MPQRNQPSTETLESAASEELPIVLYFAGENDGQTTVYGDDIAELSRSGAIFDERVPQTVAYISPNFNGFHAAAAYIEHKFNEEKSSGNFFCDGKTDGAGNVRTDSLGRVECDNDDENRAVSLMGMWESGNWFASGAYEYHEGAELLAALVRDIPRIVTIEENVRQGGFGSAVWECLNDQGINGISIERVGSAGFGFHRLNRFHGNGRQDRFDLRKELSR